MCVWWGGGQRRNRKWGCLQGSAGSLCDAPGKEKESNDLTTREKNGEITRKRTDGVTRQQYNYSLSTTNEKN